MGKFRQLSPELWPLIDVKCLFPLSILSISLPIVFQSCIRVDIRKKWFGIVDGCKLCQLSPELWPLIGIILFQIY